jgi:aldehyde:ferredoxin oxidoreductase
MLGFFNLALRIDVAQKSFEIAKIPDSVLKQTLGGKGLATHLLLKYNPPGADPLGAENHLIFATGPVTQTPLWGSCRHGVFTKSPLTGRYAESYAGGSAAEHMVAAGADAVMICGISPNPVWIEVAENSAQFHSAQDFWGLDTSKTEGHIRSWLKDRRPEADTAGVLSIGPANENRLAFAVIENDHSRSAGTTGVGTVMGSKNIKAVAFWGRRKRQAADPGAMKQFAIDLSRIAKNNPVFNACQTMGTPVRADIMNQAGGFPARGRRRARSAQAPHISSRCEVCPQACPKCLIACGNPTRGVCPPYTTVYQPGLAGPVDPIRNGGKSEVLTEREDRLTLFDTLIICRFYHDLYQWEQLAAIIAAATGMQLSVAQMRAIAARVTEDTRRFNRREGLSSADSPVQFTSEPAPEAGSASTRNEGN